MLLIALPGSHCSVPLLCHCAEEEETEEKDPNRSKRKHLGDTNWFCPVTFKERGIMFPSNPEIGAKYRERIYYLVNYEAREKFVARPMDYLRPGPSLVAITPPPDDEPVSGVGGEGAAAPPQPPALRLLIIGPKGSGKSTLGKFLADQLGLYHVSFREKLHELIMPKAKRPVGPEHKEAFAFEKEYAEMGDQEKQRVAAEEGENTSIHARTRTHTYILVTCSALTTLSSCCSSFSTIYLHSTVQLAVALC